MKLLQKSIDRICSEDEIYSDLLPLDGKHILDLGCGTAKHTRAIASQGEGRRVTAMDVDELQIHGHTATNDLPNVQFRLGGAEAIPAADETFDVVVMFKSLHHVPVERMGKALDEIHRVSRPGAMLYVSEPLFQGAFNEILSLFHDEQHVRTEAFAALKDAVARGLFRPVHEVFFLQPRSFASFADFESQVIHATHMSHGPGEEVHERMRERFMAHLGEDGAHFLIPMRVNVLHK